MKKRREVEKNYMDVFTGGSDVKTFEVIFSNRYKSGAREFIIDPDDADTVYRLSKMNKAFLFGIRRHNKYVWWSFTDVFKPWTDPAIGLTSVYIKKEPFSQKKQSA